MKLFLRSMFAIALTLVAYAAFGTVAGEWQVTVRQGSVVQGLPAIGATADAAHAACVARIPTNATARTQYFCEPARYMATVTPDACAATPPPQTRPQPCPVGRTGTYLQTGLSTVGPLPTCTVSVAWTPVAPRATDCPVTPPAVLAAPANVVALGIDPYRIRVSWGAVPGAAAYQFERCIVPTGGTCEPWVMGCYATPPLTHGPFQSPGLSVRYRIRASKDTTCSNTLNNLGMQSLIALGVAQAGTPTPTTTARLNWTAPTRNTDGSALTNLASYRIVYGRTATELVETAQVTGIPNTFTVTGLAPGTWFFAVKAVNAAGAESAQSNVVTRELP